jgi:hypothetical protein
MLTKKYAGLTGLAWVRSGVDWKHWLGSVRGSVSPRTDPSLVTGQESRLNSSRVGNPGIPELTHFALTKSFCDTQLGHSKGRIAL